MNNGTGMQTLFFELASWLHLSQTTSGVHDRFLILELNPFPRNTHKWIKLQNQESVMHSGSRLTF